jgi:urocanate hydratase
MCFDYGFGPLDGFAPLENPDLQTDDIACAVLEEMAKTAPVKFSNKCR